MLEAFIAEHCRMSPDARVTKADLYEAYCHWEQSHGRQLLPINEVGRQMKGSGFGETRTKNTRFWLGIRLIGLDAVPTSEVEEVSSTSPVSQRGFAQNGSTLEMELNERLREELHGGWTYQQL